MTIYEVYDHLRNEYQKTAGLSVNHFSMNSFPKNHERREARRVALNLQIEDVFITSTVCHLHFGVELLDYEKSPFRLHLKQGAVPSLGAGKTGQLNIISSPEPSTSDDVFFTDYPIGPSTSSGFNKENVIPELPPRPFTSSGFHEETVIPELSPRAFTSLGFVENKTPPSSPLQKSSLDITPTKRRLKKQLGEARKKIKRLRTSLHHFKKRAARLADIIKSLNGKVSDETLETLNKIGPNEEFLQRQLRNNHKYGDQLKAFSLTHHYYSVKAYNFVRNTFNSALFHPKTLSWWYKNVNGEAGFTAEVFDLLKCKAENTNYKLICGLTVDKMAIRQHVEWDGRRYYGFVDFGIDIEMDSNPVAKDAFVFMLVCINEAWKLPLGYFLIECLTGCQKKNLVLQCLKLINETGILLGSITFDGATNNVTLSKELGCNLDPNNIVSTFTDPNMNRQLQYYSIHVT